MGKLTRAGRKGLVAGGSVLAVAVGSLFATVPAQAASAAAVPAAQAPKDRAPVHLIIDTDISDDCDDTGALAIANASQDDGKVDLLGIMVDTPSKWGAPAVDAIDTYYGHGNIPIGTLKPNTDAVDTPNYNQVLAQQFPNSLHTGTRAPDATALYRKILAQQPDHSVTIAGIGFETNLENLLKSGPDQYSKLSGTALVAQKVKQLVLMGGGYPSAREFNFDSYPAATQYVVSNWPTRAVFDGLEIGNTVFTGSQLFTQTPVTDPVRKAYEIYVGDGNDRNSWDPSTVFYSIYGNDGLFTLNSDPGSNQVAADGSNTWVSSPVKDQNYLIKTASDTTIAQALSNLMVQPPRQGRNAR